eukprot:224775-Chlamydomonas_euryale.AAC.1
MTHPYMNYAWMNSIAHFHTMHTLHTGPLACALSEPAALTTRSKRWLHVEACCGLQAVLRTAYPHAAPDTAAVFPRGGR